MATQTYQLALLISVINDSNVLNTTDFDKITVAEYLTGKLLTTEEFEEVLPEVQEYLKATYPKLKEAAKLVEDSTLDRVRYNKMIDLYRMNHVIAPMQAEELTYA